MSKIKTKLEKAMTLKTVLFTEMGPIGIIFFPQTSVSLKWFHSWTKSNLGLWDTD